MSDQDGSTGLPDVAIVGVGGAGANCVNRFRIAEIAPARRVAVNSDLRSLDASSCPTRVFIGKGHAGAGAYGDAELGRRWAEESGEELGAAIASPAILFVAVGLGGGTGTGAAPVIARLGREAKAHVVVVAFLPFLTESKVRHERAAKGLEALRGTADYVLVFSNDKLVEFAGTVPIARAFRILDSIVEDLIRTVIDTLTIPARLRDAVAAVESLVPHFEVVTSDEASRTADPLATQYVHVNYGTAAQILAQGGESAAATEALGKEVRSHLERVVTAAMPWQDEGANVRIGEVVPEEPTVPPVVFGPGDDRTPDVPPILPPEMRREVPSRPETPQPPAEGLDGLTGRTIAGIQRRLDDIW